ncbi:MAG: zinc-binding dehydrogenase [Actinobacteria bacterium]|nr:zinc-binding dehydrogenase [Actinomycetota bacterium]MCB9388738.1 zinc-binding dehydrogenase [Acidimicrobiia bacterium]
MRAWVLAETTGPDGYRLEDIPSLAPKAGEVRVSLKAAALNHLDLWVSWGRPAPPLPHVAGADGAGFIDACGPGVPDRVGEPVIINPATACLRCRTCLAGDTPLCPSFKIVGEHRWGTLATEVIVPTENAIAKPPGLDWESAGSFGTAYANAVRMFRKAELGLADRVLIPGVGGGVALACLLLAKAAGAYVIVTSRNPDKLRRASELGADLAVGSTDDFSVEVLAATAGRGVDVVFDTVGPATWHEAMRSLRRGGRFVTCGASSGQTVEVHLPTLFFRQQSLIGSTMNNFAEFERATTAVGSGQVPVIIDRTFPFEDVPEALLYLEQSQQFGKVAITIASGGTS